MMKAYTNSIDTIIANSVDDAIEIWEEQHGENIEDYEDEMNWSALPGHQELSVSFVDDPDEFDYLFPNLSKDDNGIIKATVDEWIKEYGRGFLCSTEW